MRHCFEQGTSDPTCCSSKVGGCNVYDGPCREDSDCKSGACGLIGFCPQMMYPWENLHPNIQDIQCCSEQYYSVDTPCKSSHNLLQ